MAEFEIASGFMRKLNDYAEWTKIKDLHSGSSRWRVFEIAGIDFSINELHSGIKFYEQNS